MPRAVFQSGTTPEQRPPLVSLHEALDSPRPAGSPSRPNCKLDPSRPLVGQVAALGPEYDEWTHQARLAAKGVSSSVSAMSRTHSRGGEICGGAHRLLRSLDGRRLRRCGATPRSGPWRRSPAALAPCFASPTTIASCLERGAARAQALPGVPRLFGPDWMEACSKTPWWVIPLVWLPLSAACAAVSLGPLGLAPVTLAWRACLGAALWFPIEYVLHRWVFHLVPRGGLLIELHFLLHGIHHKFPNDPLRLVMPVIPGLGLLAFLVAFFRFFFFSWAEIFPLAAGTILGYISYDLTHYAIHHAGVSTPWLVPLSRSHMEHHYRNHRKGFGITSPCFDWVCGSVSVAQRFAR